MRWPRRRSWDNRLPRSLSDDSVICTITFNTWFGAFLGTIVTNNGWSNFWVDMLLKLVVMTLPTVWTYPLSRFVIHRKKKDS